MRISLHTRTAAVALAAAMTLAACGGTEEAPAAPEAPVEAPVEAPAEAAAPA